MKVKIITSIASKTYSYSEGSTVDLPKKQAEAFVKAGVAEYLEPKTEIATAPAAEETTSTRKGRKKNVDDSGSGEKTT